MAPPITTMLMMALMMALLLLACGSEADPLRVFATLDIDVIPEVGGATMETRTVRLLEGDDASVVAGEFCRSIGRAGDDGCTSVILESLKQQFVQHVARNRLFDFSVTLQASERELQFIFFDGDTVATAVNSFFEAYKNVLPRDLSTVQLIVSEVQSRLGAHNGDASSSAVEAARALPEPQDHCQAFKNKRACIAELSGQGFALVPYTGTVTEKELEVHTIPLAGIAIMLAACIAGARYLAGRGDSFPSDDGEEEDMVQVEAEVEVAPTLVLSDVANVDATVAGGEKKRKMHQPEEASSNGKENAGLLSILRDTASPYTVATRTSTRRSRRSLRSLR
eukprot:g1367.t1